MLLYRQVKIFFRIRPIWVAKSVWERWFQKMLGLVFECVFYFAYLLPAIWSKRILIYYFSGGAICLEVFAKTIRESFIFTSQIFSENIREKTKTFVQNLTKIILFHEEKKFTAYISSQKRLKMWENVFFKFVLELFPEIKSNTDFWFVTIGFS
jgi:hypothetical protein